MSLYEKTVEEMSDTDYAAVVMDFREAWDAGLTLSEIATTTESDIQEWFTFWMEREEEADWSAFLRSLTEEQLKRLAESVARSVKEDLEKTLMADEEEED